MYCRFESGVHPREPLGDLLLATVDHSNSLEDHIKYLTKVSSHHTIPFSLSLITYIFQRITSIKSMISLSSENKSKGKNNITKPDDTNTIDNKLLYEKASMRELQAADDYHPLKLETNVEKSLINLESEASPEMQELTTELESVALDWKTIRNIKECGCSTPFDHFSRKVRTHQYRALISELETGH